MLKFPHFSDTYTHKMTKLIKNIINCISNYLVSTINLFKEIIIILYWISWWKQGTNWLLQKLNIIHGLHYISNIFHRKKIASSSFKYAMFRNFIQDFISSAKLIIIIYPRRNFQIHKVDWKMKNNLFLMNSLNLVKPMIPRGQVE